MTACYPAIQQVTVTLLGGVIVKKLYVIRLSAEERKDLDDLVNKGKHAAYRRRHAQILLRADQGEHGPGEPDHEIAKQVGVWRSTVEKVRKRCVQEGLEAALERRKRSRDRSPVLDGEGEAQLIAIACSDPPTGRARWTLRLLADELQRREVVQSISHETVRRVLEKKRAQAVAQEDVVHPAQGGRGVRLRDGARPCGVHPSA